MTCKICVLLIQMYVKGGHVLTMKHAPLTKVPVNVTRDSALTKTCIALVKYKIYSHILFSVFGDTGRSTPNNSSGHENNILE